MMRGEGGAGEEGRGGAGAFGGGERGERKMNSCESAPRYAGIPGYGSDGASAEVERDIEGRGSGDSGNSPTWFLALEHAWTPSDCPCRPHPQPAASGPVPGS